MKKRGINYFKYFILFFSMVVLVLITGCSGSTPATPIINSFLANPTTITVGESSTLSWSVTDATSVTIDQSIGSVALISTTTASPTSTTTYTLTATNATGSVTGSVTVTVGAAFGSIDINSDPVGAKVYFDGIDTGSITPIILTNKDAGNHIIKLDKFHHKVWEDTAVTVNANQTTYLNPPLVYAAESTKTLQPGAEGKDALVNSFLTESNYEGSSIIDAGNFASGTTVRSYIQFNLSSVPADARVIDADLKLYQYNSGTKNSTINLYKVTSGWQEGTLNWNSQPNYSTEAEYSTNITAGVVAWKSWDIDSFVQGWLDGTISNYGMALVNTDETTLDTFVYFHSSDYATDTTKCPKLVISYYIP